MAQVLPSFSDDPQSSGASPAEWMTLKRLEDGLPNDWLVFHNIRWTQAWDHGTNVGEIDFCVLSPTGKVVIIEQKNGDLIERPDGLFKRYPHGQKNVGTQIQRSLDGLHTKFKHMNPEGGFWADYLIYLPDYYVRNINAIALDPERIVDSGRSEQLCPIIQTLLQEDSDKPTSNRFDKVRDFLLDTYDLVRDIHAYGKLQGEMYCRISGGLTTWVNRLSFEPFHLRVTGTAGCGKTQLAINALKITAAAGKHGLMLCFNHVLSSKLTALMSTGARVSTFQDLCDAWVKSAGALNEHQVGKQALATTVAQAATLAVPNGWLVDTLVVDEGQDMQPEWADLVQRLVRPNGRIIWIEDPNQRLYEIERVLLSDFVTLDMPTNYRSPRKIQQAIELLLDLGTESGNPFPGLDPEFHTYESNQALFKQVQDRLTALIHEGFSHENIAIISFKSLEESVLTNLGQLGPYRLKHSAGLYEPNPYQSAKAGAILFDSIDRYKGQQNQVILFVEIDLESLDALSRNRLYCGMTRATTHLECFFTPRTANLFSERLRVAPIKKPTIAQTMMGS